MHAFKEAELMDNEIQQRHGKQGTRYTDEYRRSSRWSHENGVRMVGGSYNDLSCMREANPNLFYVPHGLTCRVTCYNFLTVCDCWWFPQENKATYKSLWTAINSKPEISWNKQEWKAHRKSYDYKTLTSMAR